MGRIMCCVEALTLPGLDGAEAEDGDGAEQQQDGQGHLGAVLVGQRAHGDTGHDGGGHGGEVGDEDLLLLEVQRLLDHRGQRRGGEPRHEGLWHTSKQRRGEGVRQVEGGVRRVKAQTIETKVPVS